ncbi:MAG: hypothetical protein QW348_06870 [Ignisphaera sp.]
MAGWTIGIALHAYHSRPSEVAKSIERKTMEIEVYARKKKR